MIFSASYQMKISFYSANICLVCLHICLFVDDFAHDFNTDSSKSKFTFYGDINSSQSKSTSYGDITLVSYIH